MPRRKPVVDEWITGKEAAAILSERNGHEVKQNYVRYLAYKAHKIRYQERDGRTAEYLKSDVEGIIVRAQNTPSTRRPRSETEKAVA